MVTTPRYSLVFDMDGVIIDSEPLHFSVEAEMLRDLGVEVENDVLHGFVGIGSRDMWTDLRNRYRLSETAEELSGRELEAYGRLLAVRNDIAAIPGIPSLVDRLKSAGWGVAVASSSRPDHIDRVLNLTGLAEKMDAVVSGYELPDGKPHPEIYQKTCRILGIDPARAAALEDARSGVVSAKAAGLTAIAYRNPASGSQDLSAADWIVDEIPILTPENIAGLIDSRNGAG